MKVVVCIATYNSWERIYGTLYSLRECELPLDFLFMVVNTGNPLGMSVTHDHGILTRCRPIFRNVENIPRAYASVMYEKVKAAKDFCDNNTVFVNTDDDYCFNPWFLKYTERVFEENPEVNYASFLRGPGVILDESKDLVTLSGNRFFKWGSCMGGSMVVRWKPFYPLVMEFFEKYGVNEREAGDAHNFDIPYWRFLEEKTDDKVYTSFDFSLVQHCNLGSNYISEKGERGRLAHMYGENYDPMLNPFKFNGELT